MSRYNNLKWFALSCPPPQELAVAGRTYILVKVFKHDFFAATCLYQVQTAEVSTGHDDGLQKIVVKFARKQSFCGLPMRWYGRMLCRHEKDIYVHLAGVEGVPPWAGVVDDCTYAIGYIDAVPLDHLPKPPPAFFDQLRRLMDAIHSRGIAYCDANKRSNILVDAAGKCFLVDYQISFRRRDDLPWPLRNLIAAAVRYVQRSDIYHIYKHKRRLAREELTPEEEALSCRRGLLHSLHRRLTDPWRALRRRFLGRKFRKGQLASPTAWLEDHRQPEKETWRTAHRD